MNNKFNFDLDGSKQTFPVRIPNDDGKFEKIGEITLDSEDYHVIDKILDYRMELKKLDEKYESNLKEAENNLPKDEDGVPMNIVALLEVKDNMRDELVAMFDSKVFYKGFCEKTFGNVEKITFTFMMQLIEKIVAFYGKEEEYESAKYINRQQRRAGSKK